MGGELRGGKWTLDGVSGDEIDGAGVGFAISGSRAA